MGLKSFLSFFVAFALIITASFRATAESPGQTFPANQSVSLDQQDKDYRGPQSPSGKEEPNGVLTLKQALALAVLKNPDLASYSWEIRAREARALQAGVYPNPEMGLEIENWGGNKDYRRLDAAETTLAIRQLIELGGKRPKKVQLATLERDLARWDYETKRLDVLSEATKAFVNVAAEQERLTVLEELYRLAEQSRNIAAARVQAGKVSPIDETKSSAELAKTRIEMERAKRSLQAARKQLSLACGLPSPSFQKVEGAFDLASSIPSVDDLAVLVYRNPDLARWPSEIEQRKASLNLERASRIPDPSISVGVRRFNENEVTALVAGISFPLPLFNRNSGAIAEAEYRLIKAEEEHRAARRKIQAALAETYQALSSAFTEARILKDEVLPALQSAYEAAQEGYRYGKFGYLDVLDAQRNFFESKIRYVESLAAFRKAYSDVDRLTGAGPKGYGSLGE